jgi:hypothetical protein
VAGKNRSELGDASRIALPNRDAIRERLEFLRRSYEGRDVVTPFAGLANQRPPGAAGCAKNQQPHGLFPCEVVHTEETAHAAVS